MKKILALVLALAMVAMIGAVYADDETPATPVNNRTFDTTISITNLDEGDAVTLYQIIEWNEHWAPVSGYTGLSQAEVDDIVGQKSADGTKTTAAGLTQTYIDKIITSTLPTAVDGPTTITASGTYSYTTASAGMFYAIVTPKDGTKIYKPIFISSDYSATNGTETISTAAKYETITIDKHATAQENDHDEGATYSTTDKPTDANSYNTVNVGDTVDFEINTTIPKFPASFTTPIFKVSDTLNHLTLTEGSITVYAGSTPLTKGTEYTLSDNPDPADFVVNFSSDYIKGLSAAQPIKITYKAVVDSEAALDVNVKENTAEVRFSNNPADTKGANKLVDETRHYTFSINGEVFGSRKGTDLIKVGVDKDGNEIKQVVELPNKNWAGALQGAKFTLWDAETKGEGHDIRKNLVSDDKGQILITGLDAGTYWLEETEAPEGFIKSNKLVKVEIIPTFVKKVVEAHEERIDGITVTVPEYSYAVLETYQIKIDDEETATYTVNNAGVITANGDDEIGVGSTSTDPGSDSTGKIKNPQGVELPSTGGIGTTIFYILGGLLVVGAVVILVARRKAQD